jgi:bilin biosynthesis protein
MLIAFTSERTTSGQGARTTTTSYFLKMDKRFSNIFNLTEDQAIAILETPLDELEDTSAHYVAASHLMNFPTERSINALIETIKDDNPDLFHRIAKRKAVESLGRLKAPSALSAIRACLQDDDRYVVENAVWAIGEIGTKDREILEEIAQLLERPKQTYRVIIQTLAKFNYKPALDRIKKYTDSDDELIKSTAIATVVRLTEDYSQIDRVVELLRHSNVNVRRACIQDLIDVNYYQCIPQIAKSPVSFIFRVRGIKTLAEGAISSGAIEFSEIESSLDSVIRDRPEDLELVHEYDRKPTLEFLIDELYNTDFGRCYLATQTILDLYSEEAPKAILATYFDRGKDDYGANYHVIKLLGWLKYQPGYDVIVEALHNTQPQFQKSRTAAAIALGNLGDKGIISLLKETLDTPIFELKYSSLLALEQLGDDNCWEVVAEDANLLIRKKVAGKIGKL